MSSRKLSIVHGIDRLKRKRVGFGADNDCGERSSDQSSEEKHILYILASSLWRCYFKFIFGFLFLHIRSFT